MNDLPADLVDWDRTRLIERWTEAFGHPPPLHTQAKFMRLAIAWLNQSESCSGKVRMPKVSASRHRMQLGIGTLIMREWQGKSYRVQVTSGGFEYQGKTFRSLSAIARHITGTPWSGPAFFGTPR